MKDLKDEKSQRDYRKAQDKELIRMLIDGDRRAFDEFYKRYYPNLMRFVMSYCQNRTLAEDVIQDVFVKLLSLKIRLGIVKNIKSYIYSTAINRCRDIIRKGRKDMELNSEIDSKTPPIEDNADVRIDMEIVSSFVNQLPKMQKEVLLLRTSSELQFGEIGELLNISENSAKVNYFYALRSLKEMMGGGNNE